MDKNTALLIGYSVSAIVVSGSFYLFGWKGVLSLVVLLFAEQVHYRIKHGHWQKSSYVD